MNKKIIILIIAVIVALGVGVLLMSSKKKLESTNAPNNSSNITENQNSSETQGENINDNDRDTTNDKKIAIIYFSATGTTKKIAEYIQNTTHGDLIEIIPKEEYIASDLNYGNTDSRANKEQNDSNARPEIANIINTDTYDVIYLGYPIWWGDVPKIILTFLDSHDLKDKIIIPFCTSGSTPITNSLNTLKNYNKNVTWIDGTRFSSNTTQNELNSWVNSLNY